MKLRMGMQLTTMSVFILVTLFVSLVAIGLQYCFGRRWPDRLLKMPIYR